MDHAVANDPSKIELKALENSVDEEDPLPSDTIEVAYREESCRYKISTGLGDMRLASAFDVFHSLFYKWNSGIRVAKGAVYCPASRSIR